MIAVRLPGLDDSARSYLTWTPVEASIAFEPDAPPPERIVLRNAGAIGGLCFAETRQATPSETLTLPVPAGGELKVFLAGAFGRPSRAYGDARIEVLDEDGTVIGGRDTMVRVRKDATTLDAKERDRFVSAMGRLNDGGRGPFSNFRDMHTSLSIYQAHGNSAFLPWHRAYLLDLERELQVVDPEVALPYWRFDRPAATLFTREFMGEADRTGRLRFTPAHPFASWVTDNVPGIDRAPFFDINRHPAVLDEEDTLGLGGADFEYGAFIGMEADPHGQAHVGFDGPINSVPTAARDPLFFMLHANVDRLWAKWQWVGERTDPDVTGSYAAPQPDADGHRLDDTMWPWNGVTGRPRPPTAPGGTLAPSPMVRLPGPMPKVRDMFDYQGVLGTEGLGFAYDDVPFET